MSAATGEARMFKHASSDALSKIARVWLTISLLAVACMAVMLFFFAMPVWDDLVRASRPVEMGWWRYVIGFVYHHWQGRWASCGLESFVLPRVDITRFYWALIGAVAIVNAAGVYAICRWFTPLESRKTSAVISAGLLALLWAGIPSIAETVYWFTGAVENAMVLALAAILLTALLNFCGLIATKNLSYWMRIAALAIAAIVICGFHELYGSMLCLALGVGTIATFITPGTNKTAWIVVTIAASIGLAVVVLAPGNSARIASDGGHHSRQLGYDLRVAVKQAVHALPRWIIDPKLMAATVFVAFSPTPKDKSPKRNFGIADRMAMGPAAHLDVDAGRGFFRAQLGVRRGDAAANVIRHIHRFRDRLVDQRLSLVPTYTAQVSQSLGQDGKLFPA